MPLAIPGITLGPQVREDALGAWREARTADGPRTLRVLRDELVGRDDARLLLVEEGRRIAGLPATHFVSVERVELAGPQPWILTEDLTGRTLEQRLAEGPLPPEEALTLVRHLARGFALLAERRQLHAAPIPSRLVEKPRGWVWLTFRDIRAADEASALKGRRPADPLMAPPEAEAEHAEPVRAGPWAAWALGALLRASVGLGPPRTGSGPVAPLPQGLPGGLATLLPRLLEPAPRLRVADAASALALLERGAAAGPPPAPRPPAPVPKKKR